LVLVSESQEIQMGREADESIVQYLGLVEDEGWQEYVQRLGEGMARQSERPRLPWTFRVLDDPVVNAFALPGGFVYMTRGILGHFSSEAELAGVLGHEIGHVTARHSVNQLSRTQLAQIGLGVGTILAPDLAPLAQVAEAGLGLLFLAYGREDERQSDELGLRYMTQDAYDPREMAETLEMLADAAGAREGERVPAFLSTHPDPLERRDAILQLINAGEVSGEVVRREEYLNRLAGLTFGAAPRQGYFEDSTFYHPELRFSVEFPAGWQTQNGRDAVQGISPEQDGVMMLTLLEEASTAQAAREGFLAADGLTGSETELAASGGLLSATADFSANTANGRVRGAVMFVQVDGRVFRIMGYAPEARWEAQSSAIRRGVRSFQVVYDPSILNVQADRIELVRTYAELTLAEFNDRYPSSVSTETIATINHLQPGERIPAGTLVKRVVSGSP